MRRMCAVIGAAAVLVVVATTASAQNGASGEGGEPGTTRVERLTVGLAGFENNLNPYALTGASAVRENLLNMVYDSLFYSPLEPDPQPWLAENVSVSEDERTWTIDIRDGIRWHDGRPLTAEDVRFTYQYFFDSEQGRFSHHVNDLPFLEEIERVDEDTVRFTCRERCPMFDLDPGADLPILPKHIFEDVEEPAKFTEELPVGTGPYKLTEITPDQNYVFEANQDYFMGVPLVNRIDMPIIPQASSMFLALRSGEVDAVSRPVPPQSVEPLRGSGLTIMETPSYSSAQIYFNAQRPPFDKTKFRNALNLAVATPPITETLLGNRGEPGVESFVAPNVPFADPALEDKYDPDQARKLLDQLGFADDDGDGIRENQQGEPLSFEILVSADEPREIRASQLVSDQIAEVGVRTEVVSLDPSTKSSRTSPPEAGEVDVPETKRTGDFDMETSSLGVHGHFPPTAMLYFFHCPGETGFGAYITGYCNKRFDRVVEEASTLDYENAVPLLREAQRILYNDPPAIPMYYPYATHAVNTGVYNGWKPEPGFGVIHKRSFLPGPRDPDAASTTGASTEGSSTLPAVLIALAVLALVVGGGLLLKRRRRAAQDGIQGPETD